MTAGDRIGVIVDGSLEAGLTAKLANPDSVEQMRVGQFVVIEGAQHRFFSLLTDVQLHNTDSRLLADPPDNDFVRQVLAGTATYGTVKVDPMLMLARAPKDGAAGPQPVRTIPGHFAAVYEAEEGDFHTVFGAEDGQHPAHFSIGMPLDNDVPLCLDLARFVERSNGVFGKSGTGKSFLTRLILAGLIKKDVCSNLIFDMHSEYGWEGSSETTSSRTVQGLKQLFRNKVLVYTLDPKSTQARKAAFDGTVKIAADEIDVEDIALLDRELKLTATAPETAALLKRKLGRSWLRRFLDMEPADLEELATETGAHTGALGAMHRKLLRLKDKPFIEWEARRPADGSWESLDDEPPAEAASGIVKKMLAEIAAGKHIVLEFGAHSDLLSYLLVANLLTRAIRAQYVAQKERYMATKDPAAQPRPLMITVEEAHKFLDPAVARDTTFGTLAREMRKYDVTLLVVDQRPSAIDSEVLSQLGTRVCCLLDDEKDVDAILSGVSGASRLRSILATLETRGQAMLLGHALPMPVAIRTRPYDEAFWTEMRGHADGEARAQEVANLMSRFARQ